MTIEELQIALTELQDKYTALQEDKAKQSEELEKLKADNQSLRDVNQKLFLRATAKEENQPAPTPPDEDYTTTNLLNALGVKESK